MKRSVMTSPVVALLCGFAFLSHAAPATKIKFNYKGWTKTEEAYLRQFVDRTMPILEDILGPPYRSMTLGFMKKAGHDVFDQGDQVMYYTMEKINPQGLGHAIHETCHFFQSPVYPISGPWCEGIAEAVTYRALRRYQDLYKDPNVDPFYGGYTHDFTIYDFLNQPDTAGQFDGRQKTPDAARSMGQSYALGAAVLHKLLIEYPDFLKKFDADLYRRAKTDPDVNKKAAAVREIARKAVGGGTVEGMDFDDWLDRQYCMKEENAPGKKLFCRFAWSPKGPQISKMFYWKTEMTGPDPVTDFEETHLSGQAEIAVYAFDSSLLEKKTVKIKDGFNVVDLVPKNITPEKVKLFSALWCEFPNLDPQRLRIEVSIDGEKWTYSYPHRVMNGGALIGADTGEVEVEDLRTGKKQRAKIVKGVFQIKNDNPDPTTLAYTVDIDHPTLASPDKSFVGKYRRTKLSGRYIAALSASAATWEVQVPELVLPPPVELFETAEERPLLPEEEGPWFEPSEPVSDDFLKEGPPPISDGSRFEMEKGVEEPFLRTRGTRETFLGEGTIKTPAEPPGEPLSPQITPALGR